MPARILLVDDFGPFRELASLLLENHAGYTIVAEAADGRDGIQKAKDSNPDLVVLDMDLPFFNGIEVARQIRGCCPDSTILFVTGNDDPELVCEALRLAHTGMSISSILWLTWWRPQRRFFRRSSLSVVG